MDTSNVITNQEQYDACKRLVVTVSGFTPELGDIKRYSINISETIIDFKRFRFSGNLIIGNRVKFDYINDAEISSLILLNEVRFYSDVVFGDLDYCVILYEMNQYSLDKLSSMFSCTKVVKILNICEDLVIDIHEHFREVIEIHTDKCDYDITFCNSGPCKINVIDSYNVIIGTVKKPLEKLVSLSGYKSGDLTCVKFIKNLNIRPVYKSPIVKIDLEKLLCIKSIKTMNCNVELLTCDCESTLQEFESLNDNKSISQNQLDIIGEYVLEDIQSVVIDHNFNGSINCFRMTYILSIDTQNTMKLIDLSDFRNLTHIDCVNCGIDISKTERSHLKLVRAYHIEFGKSTEVTIIKGLEFVVYSGNKYNLST